jgi:hypothetical protein
MRTHTVIGLYLDAEDRYEVRFPRSQRWADTIKAKDPGNASILARRRGQGDVVVAGVVEGEVAVVG